MRLERLGRRRGWTAARRGEEAHDGERERVEGRELEERGDGELDGVALAGGWWWRGREIDGEEGARAGAGGCRLGRRSMREEKKNKRREGKKGGGKERRGFGSRGLDVKSRNLFLRWKDGFAKQKKMGRVAAKTQGVGKEKDRGRIRVLEVRWAWAGLGCSLALSKLFLFCKI